MFEMLPVFILDFVGAHFCEQLRIFVSGGPVKFSSGGEVRSRPVGWPFWNAKAHSLSLVKKTLNPRRTSFEQQRASAFRKRLIAPKVLGEPAPGQNDGP